MVYRSSLVCVAVQAVLGIVAAGCSWAEQPTAAPVAGGQVAPDTTAVDNTAADSGDADNIDALFGLEDDQEPAAAAEPAAAEEPAAANAAATAADVKVHELTERVAALETELEGLKATLYSLQQAIAHSQEPSEFSASALGAMAEDADLRGRMGEMLQGKVRLVNNADEAVVLYINGTPWTVVTGESYVLAPVATVAFMREPGDKPTFKGIQEWQENEDTGQFELEYVLDADNAASERSVLDSSR